MLPLAAQSALHSIFSFTDAATTSTYPLSLHDALPISGPRPPRTRTSSQPAEGSRAVADRTMSHHPLEQHRRDPGDRKSTRLNSSHLGISYAVFCLKKKTFNCSASSRTRMGTQAATPAR